MASIGDNVPGDFHAGDTKPNYQVHEKEKKMAFLPEVIMSDFTPKVISSFKATPVLKHQKFMTRFLLDVTLALFRFSY